MRGTKCKKGLQDLRKESFSSDASSASQKIPCILWKQMVYCGVHNSPPLAPVLRQNNEVYMLPAYF
jgi:hypothetical protein